MSSSSSNWRRVSRAHPCSVCGHDSWCTFTEDGGTVRCTRVSEGARRTDEHGVHIHVLKPGQRPSPVREITLKAVPPDWGHLAEARAAETTDEQLAPLASMWGLPSVEPLRRLTCSWSPRWKSWVLPMRRHDGRVVGAHRRWRNGDRMHVPGSQLGLFLPVPLAADDPLFLPEGASDAAALQALGLTAAGRPDNRNGQRDCCRLARGRHVVVVGENDQKPDGRWPGREGAEPLAEVLALHTREVRLLFPPAEFKDVREWIAGTGTRDNVLAAMRAVEPLRLSIQGRSA